MDDERMDERLRDYGARWAAARPVAEDVPALPVRRPRSWVPYAAAASVVAVLAGVAYAVGPRGDAGPPAAGPTASASASASASPVGPVTSYPLCAAGEVHASTGGFGNGDTGVEGWVALSAADEPCRIPGTPEVELLGDGAPVGVTYVKDGADAPAVLTATPRRLTLRWAGPFCRTPRAITLRVTAGATTLGLAAAGERPRCTSHYADPKPSLFGRWLATECPSEAWRVVSASADTLVQGSARPVRVSVVLRNVSLDFCEVNHKPALRVFAPDGRRVRLSHSVESDMRHAPPLPPGGTLRAAVDWVWYCGPDLGAYATEMHVFLAQVPFSLARHPVPPCSGEPRPNEDGHVRSEWVMPLT